MQTALLTIHIAGAGYTGLLLIQTVITLWKESAEEYAPYARKIAGMLVLQIASGCLLIIESHHSLSVLEFCSKFSLYFTLVVVVEGLLFIQMGRQMIAKFPMVFVSRAICLSVFVAIGTALLPV